MKPTYNSLCQGRTLQPCFPPVYTLAALETAVGVGLGGKQEGAKADLPSPGVGPYLGAGEKMSVDVLNNILTRHPIY